MEFSKIFDDSSKATFFNISSITDVKWDNTVNFITSAFIWKQKSNVFPNLTSEVILKSSEADFENVIKWFKYYFDITLVSKWPKISLNGPNTNLTSEADMEAVEIESKKWLHFEANAWISYWQLFINLILSNLRLHGLK